MLYPVIVSVLQVCALTALYLPIRPIWRKRAGAIPTLFICCFMYLVVLFNPGGDWFFPQALITLPWPTPHVTSPVAALDYLDSSASWPLLVDRIWKLGMTVCLLLGAGAHVIFRFWVRRSSRPASPRVEAIALEVYHEMKTSMLTERLRKDGVTPTEREINRVKRRKPPRLLVTDAVPSPASIVIYPFRVLLDREDYPDAQLRAIFRHEYAHTTDGCQYRLIAYLGVAVGWFCPAMWVVRREMRRMEEIECDAMAMRGKTDVEKREYAELLLELAARNRETPGTANAGGGVLKDRLTELYRERKHRTAWMIAALILCFVFLVGRGLIVRPMQWFQASEESIPAMLGAHQNALVYEGMPMDRLHNDLMPFDAMYTLYGAVGASYSTDHEGIIREIALHYDVAADPAMAQSGVSALDQYLTARLGAPRPAHPFVFWYDEAICWNVLTKSGHPATITRVTWSDGSYWTDKTSGGMLVKLYWTEQSLLVNPSQTPIMPIVRPSSARLLFPPKDPNE